MQLAHVITLAWPFGVNIMAIMNVIAARAGGYPSLQRTFAIPGSSEGCVPGVAIPHLLDHAASFSGVPATLQFRRRCGGAVAGRLRCLKHSGERTPRVHRRWRKCCGRPWQRASLVRNQSMKMHVSSITTEVGTLQVRCQWRRCCGRAPRPAAPACRRCARRSSPTEACASGSGTPAQGKFWG